LNQLLDEFWVDNLLNLLQLAFIFRFLFQRGLLLSLVLVALAGITFLSRNNMVWKRLLELIFGIHLKMPLAWVDWFFRIELKLQLLDFLIHLNVLLVQLLLKVLNVTLFSYNYLSAWLHLNQSFSSIFAILRASFHKFWLLRKMFEPLLIFFDDHLIF